MFLLLQLLAIVIVLAAPKNFSIPLPPSVSSFSNDTIEEGSEAVALDMEVAVPQDVRVTSEDATQETENDVIATQETERDVDAPPESGDDVEKALTDGEEEVTADFEAIKATDDTTAVMLLLQSLTRSLKKPLAGV